MSSLLGRLGSGLRRAFAGPVTDPPMRYDMRGAFGWRINRLSDGPTGLEIFGSAGFYLFSLVSLVFGIATLLDESSGKMASWAPTFFVVSGIVFLGVGSLSTGQLIYRARLRRALARTGLPTEAIVIDRWTLQIGKGTASAIRFRFTTATGSVEGVACDDTTLVSRIKIGDLLPLRYDPANPHRLLIDPVPKGQQSGRPAQEPETSVVPGQSSEPSGSSERNRTIILFATPIVIAVAVYSLVLAGVIRSLPVAGWIWVVWFVTVEGMIALLVIRRRRA